MLTPQEVETIRGGCSNSTLRQIRAAHRGDHNAQQYIDKMLGVNDECYRPASECNPSAPSTPTGPLAEYVGVSSPKSGCPLAFMCFVLALFAAGSFVHDFVVLVVSSFS